MARTIITDTGERRITEEEPTCAWRGRNVVEGSSHYLASPRRATPPRRRQARPVIWNLRRCSPDIHKHAAPHLHKYFQKLSLEPRENPSRHRRLPRSADPPAAGPPECAGPLRICTRTRQARIFPLALQHRQRCADPDQEPDVSAAGPALEPTSASASGDAARDPRP